MPVYCKSITVQLTKHIVLDGLTELCYLDLAWWNRVCVQTLVLIGIAINMSVIH
jgi:hypothetical protein